MDLNYQKKQRKVSLNDSQNLEDILVEVLSSPVCNACTQAVIYFFYSEVRNFTIVLK